MLIIFLLLPFVCFLYCLRMLKRNNQVYTFRMQLLDATSKAASNDIARGLPWEWRYVMLRKVSYVKMVHSFKKLVVENFWDDWSFLESLPPVDSAPGTKQETL